MPHAGTFNNNVLSMHAGVAALEEAFTADIAAALHARGDALRERVNAMFEREGVALCLSGVGSLMSLHPVCGPVRSPRDLEGADDRVRELLFLDLLERNIYVARRGFIALTVALEPSHLDQFVDALQEIVRLRKGVLPPR